MITFIKWLIIILLTLIVPYLGIPLLIIYLLYNHFANKTTEIRINNSSNFAAVSVNIFDSNKNSYGVNNMVLPNSSEIFKVKKGGKLRMYNGKNEFIYMAKGNSTEKNPGITM